MKTSVIISKVIFIILLLCASSSFSVFMYINKSECPDIYQCKDATGKCVNIPLYYSRNEYGNCKLECVYENRCIYKNRCVKIPKNFIKNNKNQCVKPILGNIGNVDSARASFSNKLISIINILADNKNNITGNR